MFDKLLMNHKMVFEEFLFKPLIEVFALNISGFRKLGFVAALDLAPIEPMPVFRAPRT